MVAEDLGEVGHAVDPLDRAAEVLELELAPEVMLVDDLSLGHLVRERLERRPLQGLSALVTGDAFAVGKRRLGHGSLLPRLRSAVTALLHFLQYRAAQVGA